MRGGRLSRLAAAALLLATPGWAADPPVGLRMVVASTAVTVGEPFTVEVHGEGPAGTRWEFPPRVESPDAVLDRVEITGDGTAARYRATVFALDQVALPAVAVPYRLADGSGGEVAPQPPLVRVASLLPDDPAQQRLAALRPPVSLPAGAPFWAALGLLGACLAVVGGWWWRYRRRPVGGAAAPVLPPLPPAEEARAALQRLEEAGLVERGELRAFYIELMFVAKRYLERRLEAPVLEMTSAETVAFLRDHPMARRVGGVVRDLTAAADPVKFARGEGDEDRARRHLQQARGLVDELEQALAPQVEVAPAERAP